MYKIKILIKFLLYIINLIFFKAIMFMYNERALLKYNVQLRHLNCDMCEV